MSKPRIPRGDVLWFHQESRLIGVFVRAFQILREAEKPLPPGENEISRRLSFCLRDANEELRGRMQHVHSLPFLRAHVQPDPSEPNGGPPEEKEPDFEWQWRDPQEADARRMYKHYHIECKRLGKPPSRWCAKYVIEGICRFIDRNHSYGRGLPSGMMIGYVQSWELAELLKAVNRSAASQAISELRLSQKGWRRGETSRLDQTLERPRVAPSPFHLRHFWVDLRS